MVQDSTSSGNSDWSRPRSAISSFCPGALGHVIDTPAERIRGIDHRPFAHQPRHHKLRGRGAADAAGKLIVGLQPKQVRRSVASHEGAAGIGKGGHLSPDGGGTSALGHGV